jgi:hypothetical protein
MRDLSLFLGFCMIWNSQMMVQTNQPDEAIIDSPHPGQVLQGIVGVNGSSDVSGFKSAEVSFSYMDDPTGTWFMIATETQPISNDRLATWDTTAITDGNYVLRLRVNLVDGTTRDVHVQDLRVRNYTPVETLTPPPVTPEATIIPTAVASPTPLPTPTTLAQNPATLASIDISTSFVYGGLATILLFILIRIYLWLRRK